MELQYEHIDWSDIVDAELSGDYETLRKLRDKAAKIKLEKLQEPNTTHESLNTSNSPHQSHNTQLTVDSNQTKISESVVSPSLHLQDLNTEDYPLLHTQQNKENTTLPFANFSPSSTNVPSATSYAQIVNRNPKRTLLDRCLSPTDVLPHKRPVTSDIMTTPTEYKSFTHYTTSSTMSPSCDSTITTPEATSLPGKAGLVQRRLFGTQTQEQSTRPQTTTQKQEPLTDTHRLAQRQKQIDFGKNTLGYERYMQQVPRWKRQKTHPVTPNKYNSCSTRSWQGQIRVWRRELHKFDPTPPQLQMQEQFSVADAGLCDVKLELVDNGDC